MNILDILPAVAAIAAACAVAFHGPWVLAYGIARLLSRITGTRSARLTQALVAPRALPIDRWAPASRADRRLLARSFALTMNRTSMTSMLPAAFA